MRNKKVPNGGYRQQAWDALMRQDWASTKDLAAHLGCTDSGLRNWVTELTKNGYIARGENGAIELVKNTGPIAPSTNSVTAALHDWNLNPPMDGAHLKAIVQDSGLSNSKWLESHGFSRNGSTRLNQMFRGMRPVSPTIEDAALKAAPKT